MRKIILVMFSLGLISFVYSDDAGGAIGGDAGLGGDLGGGSAMFGGDSGNSASTNSGGASVIVPPISGGFAGDASLNLNNQTELYRSTAGDDDFYRNAAAGGAMNGDDYTKNSVNSNDLWQNYSNINMRNGGIGVMGGQQAYVPSVLGTGYVANPLTSQDIFQKNVQIRSGIFLPVFGYSLFFYPKTFAPVNNMPVDANYTLGPGDIVNLKAWGSMNVDFSTPVAKDGSIFIPKVGKISVVGIKASSLDTYLKGKIGRVYRNFSMSATVSQVRSISVNVAGYAIRPGTYQLSAFSTISNAVFAVGGPSLAGSLRHIEVKRDGRVVADFDMYDVLLHGDNSKDVRLLPGDTLYFAPRGNQVAIYDGVKVPAIYETRAHENIEQLVKFAGGFNYNVNKQKVIVEHLTANQAIEVTDYDMKQGLQIALNDGDIVHFFSLNNSYESSIVLMGNVAEPTRLGYREGMRISDAIPDKAALLTKSFWNSYSYNTGGRDNLLTQIGREKTTTQVNADSTAMYSTGLNGSSGAGANSNSGKVFGASDNLFIAGPIQIPEANINWNYATVIRLNKETFSTSVIPFNLRKALNKDAANDILLQPGDVIDILSSKDVRTPSSTSTVYVFIDGEVNAPGVYEMKPGGTIVDVIQKAGGISTKAYLYGTELNRESVKKKQVVILNQMLDQLQQSLLGNISNSNAGATSTTQVSIQNQVLSQQQAFIGKMRQIKPSGRVVLGVDSASVDLEHLPDIQIENGDTIYIPTRPSTVDVIGQVYNPATFMYKPNTTVNDYIKMAGTENQFADTSNEYVLRADGTLYNRQQSGWFGGFGGQTLNPGDAVIVPQQIQFGGTMQNLLNWTQILANFGTAAAAITVFKN
ncbi:MAG: hypothetical protein EKK57_05325 [Proteobacteria bacterium]|nr:MAG: hypothetical protein EKK57_05325 [Pseudomonadota bacterium]